MEQFRRGADKGVEKECSGKESEERRNENQHLQREWTGLMCLNGGIHRV